MIILPNSSHGGIIRVCLGIFTTALRNKKICQILKKNTSPYFHSVLLVIWPLTLMKRTHFSELSNWRFSTYIRKTKYVENLEIDNSLKCVHKIKWYDWNCYCIAYFFNILIFEFYRVALSHVLFLVHNSCWKLIDRIFVASVDWLEKDYYILVSMSEFLQHLVNERMQNFCNIQCMSGHSVSVTFSVWVLAEFLRHLVNEWLQNFCNTQRSVWVVAEFLRHSVHERLQDFCNNQWLTVGRLDGLPLHILHDCPLTRRFLRTH